jgi:hypothetical protein
VNTSCEITVLHLQQMAPHEDHYKKC